MTEHFEAACNPGQVIVMEAARFGRMGLGRCVKRNYGHVGCATNVLGLTDSHCSGRRSCRFAVADPKLGILGTSPCPQDFSSYLEAKYRCVNGESVIYVFHYYDETAVFIFDQCPNLMAISPRAWLIGVLAWMENMLPPACLLLGRAS